MIEAQAPALSAHEAKDQVTEDGDCGGQKDREQEEDESAAEDGRKGVPEADLGDQYDEQYEQDYGHDAAPFTCRHNA